MMTMDPRLEDRRREVAEDRARRNVRRLIRFLLAIGVIGAGVWLFLSPWLSAQEIEVRGVSASATEEILVQERVVAGRPLILIFDRSVEEALTADPWVKDADVHVDWPDGVLVQIVERVPVAMVETRGGWAQRSVDGYALPGGPSGPSDTMPTVVLTEIADPDATDSILLLSALEFVDTLPVSIGSSVVVDQRDGELWATVSGLEVRLGRPTEMEAKALTLTALLDRGVAPGSTVNLIAPTNPAIVAPAPPEEESGEQGEESDDSTGTTTEP
jgi:cell division protein FtsQ